MKNVQSVISPEMTYGGLKLSRGSDGFDNIATWLIKSFLPASSFGVMFGASATFKSFLALEISCAIATGKSWCNSKVEKGAVIYVAAEGQLGVAKRIRAWEIANNEIARDIYVLGNSLNISEFEFQQQIINAIRDIEQNEGTKVQLLVLDTLARCFVGDENTSAHMSAYIKGCENVKTITGISVLNVHHTGKNGDKGARGSSALKAACDFEYHIKRKAKTMVLTLINTKQKEDKEISDFEFELENIDLGITCEENIPVTSLARIKDPVMISSDNDSEHSPILKALSNKFNGTTTRALLRSTLYTDNSGKLSGAERQQYRRELKFLQESEKIIIEQVNPSRASDLDTISINH